MRIPKLSETSNTISASQIKSYCLNNFPDFNLEESFDEGIYSGLGELAIKINYLISNNFMTPNQSELFFGLVNEMAESEDPEIDNLLVVGIFENSSDIPETGPVFEANLNQNAMMRFEETRNWYGALKSKKKQQFRIACFEKVLGGGFPHLRGTRNLNKSTGEES